MMESIQININGEKDVIAQRSDDTVLLASLRAGLGFPYEQLEIFGKIFIWDVKLAQFQT
jgi:hypothetical protein